MNITGCILMGIFILASGHSQTGLQMTVFRGLQGISGSICVPTAFSIVANTFPVGKRRGIAFLCLGLGQPLGWGLGLLVGGVCGGSSLGWRFAFYITAAFAIMLGLVNIWLLPDEKDRDSLPWRNLFYDIDWLGLLILTTCFGALSFVLV
jgi:MFS family permease